MGNTLEKMRKDKKGITLASLIIIIVALLLIISVVAIVIIKIVTNKDDIENKNTEVQTAGNTELNKIDEVVDIEKMKEERYPELFGDNKLFLTPPQTYKVDNFCINNEKNENIMIREIKDDNLRFFYLLDKDNFIRVEIGTKSNLVNNAEYYLNGDSSLKQTIDGITIYGDNFDTDEFSTFYVFQYYNNKRYTIRIGGEYSAIKEHITEIMDAITYESSDNSERIESLEQLTETIGKYKFDFTQNAYAYEWYLNQPKNYNMMVYLKYRVPTNNKNEYGTDIIYTVNMHVYNTLDGFNKLNSEKETFTNSIAELVKLPIDNYDFYVVKTTNKNNNSVKYGLVYLVIDNQVIQFDLDEEDYNYNITEESMVIDMINKQIINQVLFEI